MATTIINLDVLRSKHYVRSALISYRFDQRVSTGSRGGN